MFWQFFELEFLNYLSMQSLNGTISTATRETFEHLFCLFIFFSLIRSKKQNKTEIYIFKTKTEIYVLFSCPLGIISRMLSIITDTTPNLAGKIFLRITQKKKKIKQPRIS